MESTNEARNRLLSEDLQNAKRQRDFYQKHNKPSVANLYQRHVDSLKKQIEEGRS